MASSMRSGPGLLTALLLVALVPAFIGCAPQADADTGREDASDAAAAAQQAGPPQPVVISLVGGAVTVDVDTVRVRPNGAIRWSSDVPFAIVVPAQATLFPGNLPPAAMNGRANRPLQAQVRGNAPQDSVFHYMVVVWDEEAGEIRILDPEILILPSGSPGGDTIN